MKEFNEPKPVGKIIEEHFPLSQRKPTKRWIIAQSRGTNKAQEMKNRCVEAAYHRTLSAVKTLYLKPCDAYYERDQKHDNSDSFLAMHSFMTTSFYFHLQCSFCYDFEVEYAFNNCPYEQQVRFMLKAFPLDSQATESELKPDYNTFFETVMTFQDKSFLYP